MARSRQHVADRRRGAAPDRSSRLHSTAAGLAPIGSPATSDSYHERHASRMAGVAGFYDGRVHPVVAALHDVFAGVPHVMFCVKDTDGRYLAVNQAFAERAGRSVEAVLGRTAADLFPADLAAVVRSPGPARAHHRRGDPQRARADPATRRQPRLVRQHQDPARRRAGRPGRASPRCRYDLRSGARRPDDPPPAAPGRDRPRPSALRRTGEGRPSWPRPPGSRSPNSTGRCAAPSACRPSN